MTRFMEGLVTELITSFNTDGTIDHGRTGDIVEYQLSRGVRNFFAAGLAAESHELSLAERAALVRTVVERSRGQAKVMACVFVASVHEGRQLLNRYADTGYDAVCYAPPPFFTYPDAALEEFTSGLIDSCDKPTYLYNCREMGTLYNPDLLRKLIDRHPHLRGFKEASRDIILFMQYLLRIDPTTFDFFVGCDGTIAPYLKLGACGAVSCIAVPFPDLTKQVCDLGLVGKYDESMAAQMSLLRLRNVLKKAPFNAAFLLGMELMGGPIAVSKRMPDAMAAVPTEVRVELEDLVRELGL